MLEVIKFLLKFISDFITMLFSIDVGFTNLGVVFSIIYILFPVLLLVVNFLKGGLLEEFDDRKDTRNTKYEARHSKEYTSNFKGGK